MSTPGVIPLNLGTTGAGTGLISHDKLNLFWRIRQVSVDVGGGVVSVEVNVNGQPCTSNCTSSTPVTAQGLPWIDIGGHDVMNVVVTDGPPNAMGVVTYFYDEIQGNPQDQITSGGTS